MFARKIHFRRAGSAQKKDGAKRIENDEMSGEFRARTVSASCAAFVWPFFALGVTHPFCFFASHTHLKYRRIMLARLLRREVT